MRRAVICFYHILVFVSGTYYYSDTFLHCVINRIFLILCAVAIQAHINHLGPALHRIIDSGADHRIPAIAICPKHTHRKNLHLYARRTVYDDSRYVGSMTEFIIWIAVDIHKIVAIRRNPRLQEWMRLIHTAVYNRYLD